MDGPLSPTIPTTNGVNGILHHDGPSESPAPTTTTTTTFDPAVFQSYLLSLLPPVLGVSPEELETLFDEEFEEKVLRFASETGGVVYVVKLRDTTEGTVPTLPLFFLSKILTFCV
jgi:dynein heavy chain 1